MKDKHMKKANNMKDELREEYDLKSLKVRKMGVKRKSFTGMVIQLDEDVAKVFPNAQSVNEALKFLIRITKENQPK